MDAERVVCDYLNGCGLGASAYYNVPSERPDSFIVVERTGGPTGEGMTERPELAVQCWARARRDAAMLSDSVRRSLMEMPGSVAEVTGVNLTSQFRDTDLESGTPRYQLVIELYANE